MGLPWETHPKGEELRAAEEQQAGTRAQEGRQRTRHQVRASTRCVCGREKAFVWGPERTAETSDDLR